MQFAKINNEKRITKREKKWLTSESMLTSAEDLGYGSLIEGGVLKFGNDLAPMLQYTLIEGGVLKFGGDLAPVLQYTGANPNP
jgi:hypothetical protein